MGRCRQEERAAVGRESEPEPKPVRWKSRRVHGSAWRADAMLPVALRLGLALQRREQALVPRVRLVRLGAQVRARVQSGFTRPGYRAAAPGPRVSRRAP
jgi:hypothetical protein